MTNEEAAKIMEEIRGEPFDWPGIWGDAIDHAIAYLRSSPEPSENMIPTWPDSPKLNVGDRVDDEHGITRELGADGVFRVAEANATAIRTAIRRKNGIVE